MTEVILLELKFQVKNRKQDGKKVSAAERFLRSKPKKPATLLHGKRGRLEKFETKESYKK